MPTSGEGSFRMIHDSPNTKTSNLGRNRRLIISFNFGLEPKTVEQSMTYLPVELLSLLGPEGEREVRMK